MKLRQILTVTFCTVALLSAVNMQAARSKTQHLLLLYPGTVAGAHLARGQYRVKCETSGTIAKLTFVLHRKVIATVEGQVVNRNQHYMNNEVIYKTKSNGTRVITEIRFASPNQVVVFKD
ncbi:MAG: hypothetical protein P8Z30_04730 [Acidobacteriota bacterium]